MGAETKRRRWLSAPVFGIGTGAVVSPVGRFGFRGRDYRVGTGKPGPVAQQLYRALTDLQYGRAPDPYGWTRKVEVPAPVKAEAVGA